MPAGLARLLAEVALLAGDGALRGAERDGVRGGRDGGAMACGEGAWFCAPTGSATREGEESVCGEEVPAEEEAARRCTWAWYMARCCCSERVLSGERCAMPGCCGGRVQG